jgi:2-keto-4-pentenoate hydratase/2-oxohepta-3-ene-1,7-dioic acid hydratase in catechol pathway
MSYRLLSYATPTGAHVGFLVGETNVVDLRAAIEAFGGPKPSFSGVSVRETLEAWDDAKKLLPQLAEAFAAGKLAGVAAKSLNETKLLAPILYPGALFGATANYTDHLREMKMGDAPDKSVTRPCFFLKTTEHSIIGSGEPAHLRAAQQMVFWEGELGVVIGKRARSVKKEKALDYVAGYLNVLDLSDATDQAQRRQDIYGSRFGIDWFRTKCFDNAAPMGPWITPAEDVPDPQNLSLRTVTKGEVMQNSNTSNMVFTIAEQIEYLSERLTLRPGDVIATGTCLGVGRPRGLFLQQGDEVVLTIGNLGTLRTPIIRDKEP